MSTTPTTNLNLIKNNADEPIANWRTNDNANMNALDTAIKAVQDATDTLEKARQNLNNLIGVLGKNSSNADLISKAQARANLDVAQSGGAAKTLYADEQTIAQNASLIASLQSAVVSAISRSGTTFTAKNSSGETLFTFTQQDNNSLTGVKGNAESSYRTGNVNLTAGNIGLSNAAIYLGSVGTGVVTLTAGGEKDVTINIPSGTTILALWRARWCFVQNVVISGTTAKISLGSTIATSIAAADFHCFKKI